MPFAENSSDPTGTVYGWVPVTILAQVIKEAGGITSSTSLPPMGTLATNITIAE